MASLQAAGALVNTADAERFTEHENSEWLSNHCKYAQQEAFTWTLVKDDTWSNLLGFQEKLHDFVKVVQDTHRVHFNRSLDLRVNNVPQEVAVKFLFCDGVWGILDQPWDSLDGENQHFWTVVVQWAACWLTDDGNGVFMLPPMPPTDPSKSLVSTVAVVKS